MYEYLKTIGFEKWVEYAKIENGVVDFNHKTSNMSEHQNGNSVTHRDKHPFYVVYDHLERLILTLDSFHKYFNSIKVEFEVRFYILI